MEKIELGKTGLRVTRIGLGGVSIQGLAEEETMALVRRGLDLGMSLMDTSHTYGNSEARIGRAITGRREGLVLATKSMSRRPEDLRADLEQSLERLSVESIDLFQFQLVDVLREYDEVVERLLPVIDEARREGRVGHVGITTHDIKVAREAVTSGRFETLAFTFNLIACEPAAQLLPLCRQHGVGFIATNPTSHGLLQDARIAFKYLLQFPDIAIVSDMATVREVEDLASLASGSLELTEAERSEIRRLGEELGAAYCFRGGCCC